MAQTEEILMESDMTGAYVLLALAGVAIGNAIWRALASRLREQHLKREIARS